MKGYLQNPWIAAPEAQSHGEGNSESSPQLRETKYEKCGLFVFFQ